MMPKGVLLIALTFALMLLQRKKILSALGICFFNEMLGENIA